MKTFVLCDSSKTNTYGFSIDLAGAQLERFKSNPVMLSNHDYSNVVGCWQNIRIEDGKLLAEADFDIEDPLGKDIARKVEKGYLRGTSLGINVGNMVSTEHGCVATEIEVLEASIVPVPSDAGAIALFDKSRQRITLDAVKLSFNIIQKENMNQGIELTAATNVALGIDSSATPVAVEQAVLAKDTRITSLEAEVKELKASKIKTLIGAAISAKKIGEDERETYEALAAKDYGNTEKILAKMQGVAPVVGQLNAGGAASKYAGKSWDELDKSNMLIALKAEAPELYDQLYKQKFNK